MTATETLLSFIVAMNHWEIQCGVRHESYKRGEMSFAESVALGKRSYETIRDQFLHAEMDGTRDKDFHFSTPPDYDPNNEIIVMATVDPEGNETIHTRETSGFKRECIYLLRPSVNVWRIWRKSLVAHDGSLLAANI